MLDVSKYIKIPFRSHGRSFDGCDCYGLVSLILANEYDIKLPDFWDYTDAHAHAEVASLIEHNTPLIATQKKERPDEGDVVVLKYKGFPSHVGLCIGDSIVIHMLNRANAVCTHLNVLSKLYRIEGFYDVR